MVASTYLLGFERSSGVGKFTFAVDDLSKAARYCNNESPQRGE